MDGKKITDVTLKLCFNCFEEIPPSSLEKHWEECTKNNKKTDLIKKNFNVDKIDFKEETCPKCKQPFASYLLDNHVKFCSVNLKCKSCSKVFNRTLDYDEHIINCYLYKEINKAEDKECPYCQKILKDNLYEEHLINCFSELENQANSINNKNKIEEKKFPDIHPENNYPNSNIRLNDIKNNDGMDDDQPPNEKWYKDHNIKSDSNIPDIYSEIVNSLVNVQINDVNQNVNINYNNNIIDNTNDNYDSQNSLEANNEFDEEYDENNDNYDYQDQDNYEELLHLDDNVTNPLDSKYINLLPEKKVDKKFIDRFDNNNPNQCSLCMDEFQLEQFYIILPCLHFFHKTELLDWLKINKKCPVCKFEIEEGLK